MIQAKTDAEKYSWSIKTAHDPLAFFMTDEFTRQIFTPM